MLLQNNYQEGHLNNVGIIFKIININYILENTYLQIKKYE
jgi:hypothetical protein